MTRVVVASDLMAATVGPIRSLVCRFRDCGVSFITISLVFCIKPDIYLSIISSLSLISLSLAAMSARSAQLKAMLGSDCQSCPVLNQTIATHCLSFVRIHSHNIFGPLLPQSYRKYYNFVLILMWKHFWSIATKMLNFSLSQTLCLELRHWVPTECSLGAIATQTDYICREKASVCVKKGSNQTAITPLMVARFLTEVAVHCRLSPDLTHKDLMLSNGQTWDDKHFHCISNALLGRQSVASRVVILPKTSTDNHRQPKTAQDTAMSDFALFISY